MLYINQVMKNFFNIIVSEILLVCFLSTILQAEEFDYNSFPDPFLKELQRVQEEQVVEEETGPLEGIEEIFNLQTDTDIIVGKPETSQFNIEQYKIVGIAMTSVPELDLTYVVKKNDTLLKIANQFGVDPNSITKANNINPSALKVGTVLNIYSPPYMVLPAKQDNVAIVNDETVSAINEQLKNVNDDSFFHQVQEGESLSKIANLYKVSVYDLLLLNPQLNERNEHVIYVGENLIIAKQTSIDQDDKNTNISNWIEPYDYGSYWIVLAEISNYNKANELMSYFRREFDDLLFGKTIRLRENKTTSILIIEVGPYASDTMAEAVTAIFDSRLQDAKPIKLIDPNFRPSKDFSNFEPKSSAYKVNRGRNMALIQSLSNVKIYTVFEGGFLGNENAVIVKILPNKVILSNLGKEISLIYNKGGVTTMGDNQ